MDTEKNANVSSLASSRRLVLASRCRGPSFKLDGGPTLGSKRLRFEAQSAKVRDVSWVRSATNDAKRKLKWRLLAGCTGLFLAVTIIVYMASRGVPEVSQLGTQTTQSICFVTSWQRTIHPSPFDGLCQN